jgi:ATP-binding cassette subfamily F protein 3
MEYMESITPMSHFQKINSILASFMFFKESWDKKISVLSGGEKVRLSFIRLILNAGNLIILDEPTTHLDINSRNVLITALKKLDSTLIFVSHDTYFTDSLADTVLYFSSTENIEKFEGTLSEFFDHRPENFEEKNITSHSKNRDSADDSKMVDYEIMKKNRNRLNLLERNVCDLEKTIEKTEIERDELVKKLSSNSADFSKLGIKLKNIEIFLEKLINDWDNALEEIEVLKNVEQDR